MSTTSGEPFFTEMRDGEIALPCDPADMAPDAHLVFIGNIRTPWSDRRQCPHNSLGSDAVCTVEVSAHYRAGLQSISTYSHLILLYWMDRSRRDLIIQSPRHSAVSKGCFSLRTPVRPNPIALSVVELLSCKEEVGRLTIRGVDCLDGTPLIDIKPYFSTTDSRPDALNDRQR
jgi:tRNA-Thr(GGU) m(6)t(6)A37 methyltransferase TsaA